MDLVRSRDRQKILHIIKIEGVLCIEHTQYEYFLSWIWKHCYFTAVNCHKLHRLYSLERNVLNLGPNPNPSKISLYREALHNLYHINRMKENYSWSCQVGGVVGGVGDWLLQMSECFWSQREKQIHLFFFFRFNYRRESWSYGQGALCSMYYIV